MTEITTERVKIHVGDGLMSAYLARPKDGKEAPAVLVFQEIFGVNSHIRDVTERVAREGYVALAPDYFWRVAPDEELNYDQAGMEKGIKRIGTLRGDQLRADINASLAYLQSRPEVRGSRVGCMGFCIGGHVAYFAAANAAMAATASFYGGGIAAFSFDGEGATAAQAPKIRGEILCLFGGQDQMIPQDQVETIRRALKDAGVKHEVVVYPEATHGFFCDQRGSFDEKSRDDAWRRVKELFARALKG